MAIDQEKMDKNAKSFVGEMKNALKAKKHTPNLSDTNWIVLAEEVNSILGKLKKEPSPRPSHVARNLESAAKNFQKGLSQIKEMGELGLISLETASPSSDKAYVIECIKYMERLVQMCPQAAENAKKHSASMLSNEGGRTPEKQVGIIVCLLLETYRYFFGIKPTHQYSDLENKKGISLFDTFVHLAFKHFDPLGGKISKNQIEDALRESIFYRDLDDMDNQELDNMLKEK